MATENKDGAAETRAAAKSQESSATVLWEREVKGNVECGKTFPLADGRFILVRVKKFADEGITDLDKLVYGIAGKQELDQRVALEPDIYYDIEFEGHRIQAQSCQDCVRISVMKALPPPLDDPDKFEFIVPEDGNRFGKSIPSTGGQRFSLRLQTVKRFETYLGESSQLTLGFRYQPMQCISIMNDMQCTFEFAGWDFRVTAMKGEITISGMRVKPRRAAQK